MITRLASFGRAFLRKEDGNAVVEFVIVVPVFLFFMVSAAEVGMMSIRNTLLEKGLDQTVRWVRLNTGAAPTHDELKAMICSTEVVPDCMDNLHLEMIRRDVRDWQALPSEFTCTDRSLEVQPMAELSFGMDNELMVLRACAKYEPLFPGTWFTDELVVDDAGDAHLVAMSAFVQEPR